MTPSDATKKALADLERALGWSPSRCARNASLPIRIREALVHADHLKHQPGRGGDEVKAGAAALREALDAEKAAQSGEASR